MTPDAKFAAALKKGLGRAMILLRQNRNDPEFRVQLMQACKTNLVYDQQCEVSRAPYLCNLIKEIGEGRLFWDELLLAFGDAARNPHDQMQTFRILCELASSDPGLDRNMLRRLLHSVDFDTLTRYCMDALVKLQGIEGLEFCFRSFAAKVSDDSWAFRSLLDELVERDGEDIARAKVRDARGRDSKLDRLMRMTEGAEQPVAKEEPVLDRAMVKERFARNEHVPYTWIQDASDEDVEWAADELLAATDEKLILRFLRQFFWRRDFPGPVTSLVAFARAENERLARAAARAASRIRHPEVRKLAIEFMAEGKRVANGVLLLRSDWQQGDFAVIEKLLAIASEDEFSLHDLGSSILDVLDHTPVPAAESNGALLKLYEDGPCTHCREKVVAKLVASGSVPAWMAEECRYDAVPEIAALFEA
ncbi:MAG: hypothetical protein KBA31_21615 [Alphaproteobacteria bacterium]|nr:hypothetical protein [Alphaproteobacteria bacterium]